MQEKEEGREGGKKGREGREGGMDGKESKRIEIRQKTSIREGKTFSTLQV
jgi:hypothetical protein